MARHDEARLQEETGEVQMLGKIIKSEAGETLVEGLVAIAIIAVVAATLAGAIVVAANINASLKNDDVSFNIATSPASSETTVTIMKGSSKLGTTEVTPYQSEYGSNENYYYYYEAA